MDAFKVELSRDELAGLTRQFDDIDAAIARFSK